MEIYKALLLNNRPGTPLDLKGVVIHWTANEGRGANAIANRNYFNRTNRTASAHYIVDSEMVVQCIPDDEMAWHVGDRPRFECPLRERLPEGSPNKYLIGVEMCVNSDGDFTKTYLKTVELARSLMAKYDLTTDDIYRHYDITGKDCPKFFLDDRIWEIFKWHLSLDIEEPKTYLQKLKDELRKATKFHFWHKGRG